MTERRHHVSNSEIQTFKRCRRKWWLGYYRKLRKVQESKTGALVLGTNVHEALADFYSPEPKDPIETLRRIYDAQRMEAANAEDFETLKRINKDADLAMAMIEGYVDWVRETGVDDDLEVISVEEEIAVDIDDLPVTLIGKLDTRVRRRSDGRLLSMDHKTCASIDDLCRNLELNEQPLMYQLLERLNPNSDEHVVGGIYNMLRKIKRTANAKPPFYHREHIHHSDIELRNFYVRLHGELEAMLAVENALDAGAPHQQVAYPTAMSTCSWDCDYRAICPMFDDGSHVEGVIEAAYRVHNPYQRYDMMEEK